MLFNQDQFFQYFFYLNKWDLNNSYLDNQQLVEVNSKSSERLHKNAHGILVSDFENTLAELVQMKEKLYPNTGLKKAFIKQSDLYKQQEDIPLDCLSMTTIFNTLVNNSTRSFQSTFTLNNNGCCIESLSIDSCPSLHLQALKESTISKQLTICPKDQKFGLQILLENIKYFSKQKVIVHNQDQKSYLENKLDSFSLKQQRFVKQRKFTWQSPLYGISFEHTSVKLNLNYQNKKSSIADFYVCTKAKRQNHIFWFKQKNSCNSIADQNLISFCEGRSKVQNLVKKSFVGANDANSNLSLIKRKLISIQMLTLNIKNLNKKALLNKSQFKLSKTSAFFQYVLDNAELLIKTRELENLGNYFESKSNSKGVLTNCSLLSALSFYSPFLQKKVLSSSGQNVATVSFDKSFCLKKNICHFVATLQPIGQLNLKAFFSQTNSKFNAVFAKQSKQHHFLIKESNQKLHLSTIKHLCHLNSDLKLNEKTIEFANQFGDNQFTWRYKYKTEISSSIIFFTNRPFKQQTISRQEPIWKRFLLINKNQLNNYDGFTRTSLITHQFYTRLIKKLTSTLENISINTIQPSKRNRSNLLNAIPILQRELPNARFNKKWVSLVQPSINLDLLDSHWQALSILALLKIDTNEQYNDSLCLYTFVNLLMSNSPLTEGSLIPKPASNLEIDCISLREQSIFIEKLTISTQLNLKTDWVSTLASVEGNFNYHNKLNVSDSFRCNPVSFEHYSTLTRFIFLHFQNTKAQQSSNRAKLNYSCNIWENQFQIFCFSRLNKNSISEIPFFTTNFISIKKYLRGMTLNLLRLEIEPEFLFITSPSILIKASFPGIKYNSFFDSQLNSYSNITGDQLQQRSFDHLDSIEIKTNYRNFNRFKAFKSTLSFYATKFCLLEGTINPNGSASFDNIVETKEQLSRTKNQMLGVIENTIDTDQTNCFGLTENNNAIINYSKLINLKGLKLPLIENIIKLSFNYSHLVDLGLHQVMEVILPKEKRLLFLSLTTLNFNSITRYQPKLLLKAHKPLKNKSQALNIPLTSSDKLLTIYIGSFLKPKSISLLTVELFKFDSPNQCIFLLNQRGTNYLVETFNNQNSLQNHLMVKNKRLKNSLQSTILNAKQLPRFKKLAFKEKTQRKFSDLRSLILQNSINDGSSKQICSTFLNNNSDSSLSSVNWSLVHCMNPKPTFFNKQVSSNFRKFISKVELSDSLKKINSLKKLESCHWNYEFDGLINSGHANLAFKNQSIKSSYFKYKYPMHLIQYSFTPNIRLDNGLIEKINVFPGKTLRANVKKTSTFVKYFQNKLGQSLFKSSQVGLSEYQGEVVSASSFPSFSKSVQTQCSKLSFPEVQLLTDLDLVTWDLSQYKNKVFKIYLGQLVRYGTEIIKGVGIPQSGQVILLTNKKLVLRRAQPFLLPTGSYCRVSDGDFVANNSPLLTLTYKTLDNDDIVQGIPKIEQLFEARENVQNGLSLNNLVKEQYDLHKKSYSKKDAVRKSVLYIQQYIIDGIQYVYQSQGVNISDKHIEIIVKQMTSKVRITNPGTTSFFAGEITDLEWAESVNRNIDLRLPSKIKSQYEPIVLGITKASLETDGFLSAASFQETIKILSQAAFFKKRDFLRGLKENVILGHLLPAGTGFKTTFQL
jgi:hypothetical protein